MKTWIVTGAAGFLGRHLVHELLDRGDRVRALVRRPTTALPPAVEQHSGDVLSYETLPPLLEGADGVFHLAGKVDREGARDALFAVHVDGTANVLRAAANVGVRRLVLASSSGTVAVSGTPVVHGDDAPFATEVVKDWPYYTSKIHAEAVAERMARTLGVELVTLRPSLLLGPDDFGNSSTDDVRRLLRGDVVMVPEGGVCFVDVRDAAATFARAMTSARAGSRYLLGAANMTLRDFSGLVANVADVDPPLMELAPRTWRVGVAVARMADALGIGALPDRISLEMARHFWYCDWSRACAEIGHSPRPPVETIEDTVAWLQAYGDLQLGEPPRNLLRLRSRG